MNDHLNGSTALNQPTTGGLPSRAVIDHVKGVLVVVARGMFSLLQALQYEGLVINFAQACGEVCAEACWCNDVMHTINLRKKIKDAFEHGVKGVPSMAPAQPGQMPQQNNEQVKQ